MRARSCFIHLWIANDQAQKSSYSLKPMPAAELEGRGGVVGGAVAGFFLEKHTASGASPVYAVHLDLSGMVVCTCPQYTGAAACKHADALAASGLLPCGLLSVLADRTKLLDRLEEDTKRHGNSVANLTASVSNLNQRCACLQQMLDESQDEILRLERPPARRSRKLAA